MPEFVAWMGGLPPGVEEGEIERFLKGYGELGNITVRSSARDVFAFVTFLDEQDGEEAIRALDQRNFLDTPQVVQMSRSNKNNRARSRSPRRRSPSPRHSGRRGDRDSYGHAPSAGYVAFLGGLPRDVTEDDVREFFRDYGKLTTVRIRMSNKDCFAFVTFVHEEDGKDAVRSLDQRPFLRSDYVATLRESKSKPPPASSSDARRYDDRDRDRPRPRRPELGYAIKISPVPYDMEWSELKDIARQFGESVKLVNVFKEGGVTTGAMHYELREDASYALKQFDNRRLSGQKERLRSWKDGDW